MTLNQKCIRSSAGVVPSQEPDSSDFLWAANLLLCKVVNMYLCKKFIIQKTYSGPAVTSLINKEVRDFVTLSYA